MSASPSVIVTFEGINFSRRYIVKELTFHYVNDATTAHFFFNPPKDLQLTQNDREIYQHHRNITGGMALYEDLPGALPYECLNDLLLLLAGFSIIVVGDNALKLILNALSSEIEEIQTIGRDFEYPETFPTSQCEYLHENNGACSMAKTLFVKDHLLMHET